MGAQLLEVLFLKSLEIEVGRKRTAAPQDSSAHTENVGWMGVCPMEDLRTIFPGLHVRLDISLEQPLGSALSGLWVLWTM